MIGRSISRRMLALVGAMSLGGLAAGCGEAAPPGAAPAAVPAAARTPPELEGAVAAPGAIAPGCLELRGGEDGQVIELCGQDSLQPFSQEEPLAGPADSPDAELPELEAAAASGGTVKASTTGARVEAKVIWTSAYSFELRPAKLWDTQCDGNGVFFHTHIPGFVYPNHRNDGGCGSVATWSALRGSSSYVIHHLSLSVCRDKLIDNCADSNASYNPYHPYPY